MEIHGIYIYGQGLSRLKLVMDSVNLEKLLGCSRHCSGVQATVPSLRSMEAQTEKHRKTSESTGYSECWISYDHVVLREQGGREVW